MDKIITYENLRSFAYSNDKLIKGDIKAICLDFFGLGCQAMYHEDTNSGKFFAENNVKARINTSSASHLLGSFPSRGSLW